MNHTYRQVGTKKNENGINKIQIGPIINNFKWICIGLLPFIMLLFLSSPAHGDSDCTTDVNSAEKYLAEGDYSNAALYYKYA